MRLLFNHFPKILNLIIPILIVFVLVMLNVRLAVNSLPLQEALFDRNNVSTVSNLSSHELREVSTQIQNYFNDSEESLVVIVAGHNSEKNLFTPSEVSHMADVKNLFQLFFTVQNFVATVIFICTVLSYVLLKNNGYIAIAKWFSHGGILSIFSILLIGIVSIVAFEPLFTLFHYIGFPQGNWTFNPHTSALIQIFPLGFWRDITLVIASLTVFEALLLIAFGQLVQRIWKPKS